MDGCKNVSDLDMVSKMCKWVKEKGEEEEIHSNRCDCFPQCRVLGCVHDFHQNIREGGSEFNPSNASSPFGWRLWQAVSRQQYWQKVARAKSHNMENAEGM